MRTASDERIAAIDGLRGLAVGAVVIWHYAGEGYLRSGLIGEADWALALSLLWSGVTLFFVLSGYLIGGILMDHADAPNYYSVFYIRRCCRILPLYAVLVGLYAALLVVGPQATGGATWLIEPQLPLWSYATFLQNVMAVLQRTMGGAWLSPTWSLAVEEHFYLALPVLIHATRKRAGLLFGLCVGAILLAVVLRWRFPGGYVLMPWHADALMAGVALALAQRTPRPAALLERVPAVAYVLAPLLGLAGVWSAAKFGMHMGNWLLQFCLAATFVTVLAGATSTRVPRLTTALGAPILVWLGTVSYGIYLVHMPVAGLVFGWSGLERPNCNSIESVVLAALATAATVALAQMALMFVETPFIRIGKRWAYLDPHRNTAAIGPPAAV